MGQSATLFPQGAQLAFGTSAFSGGRLIVGLLLIPLARTVLRLWKPIAGGAALSMLAATGFAVLAPHQTLVDPGAFCNACIMAGSMCYTVLTTTFYLLLAYRGQTAAAACAITASLLAEMVVSNMVLGSSSFALHAWAVLVSPVLLGVCLLAAFTRATMPLEPNAPPEDGCKTSLTAYLPVFRLMIYAVALVCIKCLSNVGAWGANRGHYLGVESVSTAEMLVICLLVVVLTALVFVIPSRRLPYQVRSIAGFAVVLLGLQILALGDDLAFGNFFDLVTVSCESFAHLLMWMTFIECVTATPVTPFRLTGIRSVLYVVTASLLSMALDAGIASSTVVMVAIYALFLLLVLALVADNAAKAGRPETQEQAAEKGFSADVEAQKLDAFAQQHGLSGKEREIMGLLVGGAKRSDIEAQLGLSEGTVRTHISRMYRKLDVHSKGELVELLDADPSN